jgi:DNA-binding GntR family transcriptional regulator
MTGESQTLSERIRHDLANDILSGRRQPGALLEEQELASHYGVSRTPIREALRSLAASGLVIYKPNRRAEVAKLSRQDLHDMFQVMADLEGLCAGYAARAMTPSERAVLGRMQSDMASIVREGDAVAYAQANDRFHALIYAGSHNAYLVEITLQTRQRLKPYRQAQFNALGRLSASHAEHERIVQAILRGDYQAATKAMMEHIGVVRDAFLTLSIQTAPNEVFASLSTGA